MVMAREVNSGTVERFPWEFWKTEYRRPGPVVRPKW
jgi:hypothetical protein